MASSPELLSDAFIETTISGAEVPTETMVRPITRGEIPIFRAKLALLATNLSAPHTRPAMPSIIAPIDKMSVPMMFLVILFIQQERNGIVRTV